jgi:hypothetical protein
LRLAIELSLADAAPRGARPPPPVSVLGGEFSGVVARVPNKSVEDLAIPPPPASAAFGLVKDLHVSNILPSDADKTKDFHDKDFSQVFVKYASPTDMNAVFEPRPPQSPYSPRPPPHTPDSPPSADPWRPRTSGSVPAVPSPAPAHDDMPHVDARMLESLLQGAERYHRADAEEAGLGAGLAGAGDGPGAELPEEEESHMLLLPPHSSSSHPPPTQAGQGDENGEEEEEDAVFV